MGNFEIEVCEEDHEKQQNCEHDFKERYDSYIDLDSGGKEISIFLGKFCKLCGRREGK